MITAVLLYYSYSIILLYIKNKKLVCWRWNLQCAREITCHMGSHSITYHPTEVILTLLPRSIAGTHLSTPEGRKAELTWAPWVNSWLRTVTRRYHRCQLFSLDAQLSSLCERLAQDTWQSYKQMVDAVRETRTVFIDMSQLMYLPRSRTYISFTGTTVSEQTKLRVFRYWQYSIVCCWSSLPRTRRRCTHGTRSFRFRVPTPAQRPNPCISRVTSSAKNIPSFL